MDRQRRDRNRWRPEALCPLGRVASVLSDALDQCDPDADALSGGHWCDRRDWLASWRAFNGPWGLGWTLPCFGQRILAAGYDYLVACHGLGPACALRRSYDGHSGL